MKKKMMKKKMMMMIKKHKKIKIVLVDERLLCKENKMSCKRNRHNKRKFVDASDEEEEKEEEEKEEEEKEEERKRETSVPVARSLKHGRLCSAKSCTKEDDGPFECLECKGALIVKQGEILTWHFAHAAGETTICTGRGETIQHARGKVCFVEHLPEWVFNIVCPRCRALIKTHEFGNPEWSAEEEYRFELPGTTGDEKNINKHFVFDVVVRDQVGDMGRKSKQRQGEVPQFIIEVKQTHACTVAKKAYLNAAWKGKWLEIEAETLLDCEDRDDFELELLANKEEECSKCVEERKKIKRQGEEKMGFGKHREQTREWVYEHERRYVTWCGKQEANYYGMRQAQSYFKARDAENDLLKQKRRKRKRKIS